MTVGKPTQSGCVVRLYRTFTEADLSSSFYSFIKSASDKWSLGRMDMAC